ncbi:hypothetical protein [Methanococcoides methylutens]|uniref:Uncharacterized protein n=1 Tax=Methanococcoides methylutens MM1 TaxID=1434104 RepID=A0A0E3STF9_METMT|nr:hypothetical protein [Methanococcoides methylutens]AKB86088.1 hypothetical protein MCMEM_2035 [Methanococcoides methylutens MM1]
MKNEAVRFPRTPQERKTKLSAHNYSNPLVKVRALVSSNDAYIPFSVIGIFVILGAVLTSAYFLQMDYEIAQTIYTTEKTDPEKVAIGFASADLSRCLNYAGMEALKWKGEHPIIQPVNASGGTTSEDDFMVNARTHDLEPGDTFYVRIDLPSDVWYSISSIWKNQSIILRIKDSNGQTIDSVDYGEAVSFWKTVSFEESFLLPLEMEPGYGTIELECGGSVKATDWFSVAMNPVKDISAKHFNELITGNYQYNNYVYDRYAINVEPDIEPYRILIEEINGTLERQINDDNRTYPIYYTFTIRNLNYTLVDLETGESFDRSMDISTLVTSREPLLEELTTEYERSLNSAETSNIVLGAMNIRSFTYGPWQHYANGPLNIITNPALASAVNAGTAYAQKRTFDSVDPWALMYTTYYNGKVFYEDVHGTADKYDINSSNSSANLTSVYEEMAQNSSFNIDIKEGIGQSMEATGTTFEQVDEQSAIVVAASDYLPSLVDGWVFNDHLWTDENDLVHDVAQEVYSAGVQAQVKRDGFNETVPVFTDTSGKVDSTSYNYHTVSWKASYNIDAEHTGAIEPSYLWDEAWSRSYDRTVNPKINPPRGSLTGWKVTGATVSLQSVDAEVSITPMFRHRENDNVTGIVRTDGYLDREDHVFDWDVTYNIDYKVTSRWKIYYTYYYTYKWKVITGYRTNEFGGKIPQYSHYSSSSTGSRTEYYTTTETRSTSHLETETENLSILYHQRPPTGTYEGFTSYTDPVTREYHDTTIEIDGIERQDPACSDAADKYKDQYVDIHEIESRYMLFPNDFYLQERKVECDIPEWLHKMMADELLEMVGSIEADDPAVNVSLMNNPGADPTMLRYEAAKELTDDLSEDTEIYVKRQQYLTSGEMYTSSDAARYIAKNEAYRKLMEEIESQNRKLNSDLNDYLLEKLTEANVDIPGLDTGALDSVTSGSLSLFNNPAVSMAGTALGTEMGIIDTMTITGMPESKYNWTEGMTLVVDQYPDYLYHDPEFDLRGQYELKDPKGMTIYPLGVKNTCVFSTGIADDIAGLLEQTSAPVKEATAQMVSSSIEDLSTEVKSLEQNLSEQAVPLDTTALDQQVTGLTTTYSSRMREDIPTMIAEEIQADPVVSLWITETEVTSITQTHLHSLPDSRIINQSADGTLSTGISEKLRTEVIMNNPNLTGDEMDAVLNRLDTDVRVGIANGISVVIIDNSAMIDASFAAVNSELQKLTDDATSQLSEDVAEKVNKRLERTMKHVPMGLPVLPPHWMFTVNVWTYDVIGKYEYFRVSDNDNEVILNTYVGHEGQVYVREDAQVYHPFKKTADGRALTIGENRPIFFEFNGYAATIVGTGPKGVGDKSGERSEKSIGYDDILTEYEATR